MNAATSTPPQEDLLRQLTALTAQLEQVTREREQVTRERDASRQRVRWLETQLERLRFGQKTPREHVDSRQIQLAFEPFFQDLVGPAPAEPASPPGDEPKKKKRTVTRHGRRDLAADLTHLPVQVIELRPHPLPEGAVLALTEVSWRLGFQRARWVRLKVVRPVFAVTPAQAAACDGTLATFTDTDGQVLARVIEPPSTAVVATSAPPRPKTFEELTERTLLAAAMPAEVVSRGLPSPELLAHLLHAKFALHLPFHRLEQQCARGSV